MNGLQYKRATNQAGKNDYNFKLEMIAIVRAAERFYMYLYEIDFIVVTDYHELDV
jgi:hypothetical protein